MITFALRVIQGCTARRSEIRAPEKHVGAAPTSGVSPTEPGGPVWESWADVDDRAGFDGGGKVEAAGGAAAGRVDPP